jgi:hypothetical protein
VDSITRRPVAAVVSPRSRLRVSYYWRLGNECHYLQVMLREHDELMKHYRQKAAILKADLSMLHYVWEVASRSTESRSPFAGARWVKLYFRRELDCL